MRKRVHISWLEAAKAWRKGAYVLGCLALGLWGCAPGRLKGEVFEKGKVRYHVAQPDAAHWRQVKFSGNDIAFVSREGGFLLALNASCKEHADAPLEVLLQHLLIGFTEREQQESARVEVDGREGLRRRYVAKIDGVARELELFVLKKDGCVFDISYVAPLGKGAQWRGAFEQMVSEFQARVN